MVLLLDRSLLFSLSLHRLLAGLLPASLFNCSFPLFVGRAFLWLGRAFLSWLGRSFYSD